MSVSHNLITDNHCSKSHIPQPAVEEIKKWRCTKMNNGEQHDLMVDSPQLNTKTGEGFYTRLSENEDNTQKMYSTKLTVQGAHPRIYRKFYVRLAEESPKRSCDELSDSSTYDSYNCQETDVCRDSTDTESNSSYSSGEIGATIKVVEYEVASASNTEDLYTNDSSSGTDDFLLAAVAQAICNTSKCSSDFADTEEDSTDTDTTYDSEFSLADYWVCVKCKNKQNNPMFRYCEKCYQIRKTHFPPRPRLRKSRSTIKQHRSTMSYPSIKRSATTSEVLETIKKRKVEEDNKTKNNANPLTPTSSSNSLGCASTTSSGRLTIGISRSQLNSTAESSSDSDNNASQFYKTNQASKEINFEETQYSKYFPSSKKICYLNEQEPAQHLRLAAKRKLSKAQSKYKTAQAKRRRNEDQVVSSFAPSDTENETDFILTQSVCGSTQGTQKDSGFSSAPSSQERKSSTEQRNDDDEDCVSDRGNGFESSDTVCDELNESDVAEMSQETFCPSNSQETNENSQKHCLERRSSEILTQSSSEPLAITPLVQSVSECSDAYTNIKASSSNPESLKILPLLGEGNQKEAEFPSYGSCMTCLAEPKNGVFVHSKFLHLCCCYKCAVKIWNKNKKCPICNCAVKNVMKLFVH